VAVPFVPLVAFVPVGGFAEQVAEDVAPVLPSSAPSASEPEEGAEHVVAAFMGAEHRCCHGGSSNQRVSR
jgi:hypothetical protein